MSVQQWFRSVRRARAIRFLPRVEPLEARTVLTFARPVNYLVNGTAPMSVAAGDFNGDKIPDLVTANNRSDSISVLLGNGDGTFATARNYPVSSGPNYAAVADFNNDNNLDVAVAAGASNNLALLLGNGDGTLREAVYFFTGQSPLTVAVGDFDANGSLDAAVVLTEISNVGVLLGNGDGTFRTTTRFYTGYNPTCVRTADMNRDGRLDLVTINSSENHGSVLLGNGNGTFGGPLVYGLGEGVRYNLVEDFNNDGRPDVAAASVSRGLVHILLGNGDGTFFSRREFAVGSVPLEIGKGDFNADGIVDLVTANSTGNNVSVLFGNGDGTFRASVPYPAGSGSRGVAVGDWNLDGLPDLAIANANSNDVSILLNDTNAADRFRVTVTTSATAGSVLSVTVSARSRSDNIATGYRGTVRFTSSDPAATLPTDTMYTEADQGSRTFNVTLRTAGNRTITVTDTANGSILGTATVLVNPAAASQFVVAGFPPSVTAGDLETFVVTARDPFGNVATGYRGTVRFTSSDPQATLPRDYTFTAGDGGARHFGAILKTAGTQALTATDTANPALTGAQTDILVNPGAAAYFYLGAPETVLSGAFFDLYVFAFDAYSNVATGYRGQVGFFSSTDPGAVLPAEYTFTPSDAGVVYFPGAAVLFTPGEQDIWVYDTTQLFAGVALVNVMPAGAPGGGGGLGDLAFLDQQRTRKAWWTWVPVVGRM